jgi:hypothetical protein
MNFSMELGSLSKRVPVEAGPPLIRTTPQRRGDFLSNEVRNLPLVATNPRSVVRTLPVASEPAGTSLYGRGPESSFSVNRPLANNYLLDSTDREPKLAIYQSGASGFNNDQQEEKS